MITHDGVGDGRGDSAIDPAPAASAEAAVAAPRLSAVDQPFSSADVDFRPTTKCRDVLMRSNAMRLAVGLGSGVCLAAFAVLLLTAGSSVGTTAAPVASLVFGLLACGLSFRAAHVARGRQRSAWTVLAVGLSAWAVSAAVWLGQAAIDPAAAASWWLFSLGYLLLPIAGLVAAALVPSSAGAGFGGRLMLDGLLVTSSLVLIAVVGAHYLDVRLQGAWAVTGSVTAAYFALATIAGVVVAKAASGYRWSPGLVAAGFLIIGATGALNIGLSGANDRPSNFALLGWACGLYCLALAALASRPGPDVVVPSAVPPTMRNQCFICALLVLATTLGGIYLWPGQGGRAVAFHAGLVLVVVALIRHLLLLRHNRQLQLNAVSAAGRHPVTGLSMRGELDESLAARIRPDGDNAAPTSLVAVSLTDFGMIKEAVGYPSDDALLREAGRRVFANAHPGATVAHVGEETFAVVIAGGAEAAGDLAAHLVAAFDEPFDIGGNSVHVHVRHGTATYPNGSAPATNGQRHAVGDELLAHALSELQPAGSGVRRSDGGSGSPSFARVQLIHELRQAIDNGDLTLLYQPKFNLRTKQLCGAEALVRWPHHELGLLAPADFLPLVNELNLAEAVTDVVLRRAIADAAAWRAAGPTIPIAVNLSAPSLIDHSLSRRIATLLAAHRFAARDLTIEITEDLLISDLGQARNVLHALRETGVRVAIDDFGSGYGSLAYLRELPIDDIKIDRQFIAPIVRDSRAAAIVKATVDLATTLDLTVTAEGVEDQATADKVEECGCQYVQGNFFGPPVPAAMIRSIG